MARATGGGPHLFRSQFLGVQTGVLHTWLSKPRNKTFTPRARCRAIFWVLQLPCASMAAQAALTCALATLWRVHRSLVVCVTAPTGGREKVLKSLRKSSARATSAGAQDGRPLSSRAHARTTQDPVRVCHGSLLPAALGPRRSNTHQSLQLSPSAMISSPTVSAC